MSDFKLHCFAPLFLALAQQKWEPVFVDYLNGETRTREWRETVNEQGEAPVLEHQGKKLTQSALILDHLAQVTGKFGPESEEERQEIWRWMLFDNHKFTSYYATLRFMYGLQKSGETPVTQFFRDHRDLHSFPTRRSSDLYWGSPSRSSPISRPGKRAFKPCQVGSTPMT